MTFKSGAFASMLMGFTCLSALPAFAEDIKIHLIPSAEMVETPQMIRPHGLPEAIIAQQLAVISGEVPPSTAQSLPAASPASKTMTAGDGPVTEGTFSNERTVASMAARNSAAGAAAICEAYFTQSKALTPNLVTAYSAIRGGDKAAQVAILPALQVQLNGLLPYEIKAEVCDGDHINAYTDYQYFELSTLRSAGVDGGFPANLPLIKQPDLNLGALIYAVGWIKYEQSDFEGALAAFGKGLAIYPHNHTLQSEYIASLLQLRRADQLVAFTEKVLTTTNDLDDATRSRILVARAIGMLLLGSLDGAESSLSVALAYNYTETGAKMLAEIRAAKEKAK